MTNRERGRDQYSTDAPPDDFSARDTETDAKPDTLLPVAKPRFSGRYRDRINARPPRAKFAGLVADHASGPSSEPNNGPRPSARESTQEAAGKSEADRHAALDEAVAALAKAFNNVAKIKQLPESKHSDFLMRFVSVMLENLGKGPPPRGSGELPTTAPEAWANRDRRVKTNPAQFVRRVYELWLGNGLKRGHLRDLDPQLYQAFANWVSRHPEDDIPELARQYEEVDTILAELSVLYEPDQLRRLGMALHSRLKRNNNV